jgi:hypothetical protein
MTREDPIERFWSKVERTDGCWLWTGGLFSSGLGYGQFQYAGKPRLAHRMVWFMSTGRWPATQIAHSCDEPRCVRLSHLFEATPLQNNRDMIGKGRNKTNGKLTDEQCREIRQRIVDGPRGTAAKLAREYGVSEAMISMINRGLRRSP